MFILGCFFLGVDVLHGNFAGLKHVHFQESFTYLLNIDEWSIFPLNFLKFKDLELLV